MLLQLIRFNEFDEFVFIKHVYFSDPSEISINLDGFKMLNHQKQFNFCINPDMYKHVKMASFRSIIHWNVNLTRYQANNTNRQSWKKDWKIEACVFFCTIQFQKQRPILFHCVVCTLCCYGQTVFHENHLMFKWIEWECQALKISQFKYSTNGEKKKQMPHSNWQNNTFINLFIFEKTKTKSL